jgi:DNA polymerase III gamma/tau subunit
MELFGYDDKIKTFRELIREKKLSQAYLFYGDKGIGKSSFAKLLACALEFGAFEESSGTFLDFMLVSLGEEEGSLGIGKVLELKKFLWQKPFKSDYRLAVVDGAENLTDEAQSALLKIVEEPPAHTLLIFIAHDPQVILPPLLSRLSKVYFPRMRREEVKKILSEKFKADVKKAAEIAEKSFGRMGYALNLLKAAPGAKEENLEDFLERNILKLRRENLKKNFPVLSRLLEREALVKRYNLNMNLQRKAVEEVLKK